jgi:tRNA 2-thiocytidine biosynthesis protein TtcA
MLQEWGRQPGRIESIIRALTDVVPSHLLDRSLFDFAALQAGLQPSGNDAVQAEPLFAEP